jgi:hypothetical protein
MHMRHTHDEYFQAAGFAFKLKGPGFQMCALVYICPVSPHDELLFSVCHLLLFIAVLQPAGAAFQHLQSAPWTAQAQPTLLVTHAPAPAQLACFLAPMALPLSPALTGTDGVQ